MERSDYELEELDLGKVIKYFPLEDAWGLNPPHSPAATIEMNNAFLRAAAEKSHGKVFPKFNESEDYISTAYYYGIGGAVTHFKRDPNKTHEHIPPGWYGFKHFDSIGLALVKFTSKEPDSYVDLHSPVQGLTRDISTFFEKRNVYKSLGMKYKRSCLIYGPPGNGKTLEISRVADECMKNYDCLVIMLSNEIHPAALTQFKSALKDRKVIFVVEEITDFIDHSRSMDAVLNFFDGELSWENSYIAATTNYPEKLPGNFVDRPGRFDLLVESPNPNRETRKTYLSRFTAVDESLLDSTDGYSVSYLREVILQAALTSESIKEIIKKMTNRRTIIKSRFKDMPKGDYI